jgi:hypothetical protein
MISGQGNKCRPKILWLADKPGWAYDSIVKQIGAELPEYEHQVYYMMDEHSDSEWVWLGWKMGAANIVVAMHWMYQVMLQFEKERTVIMFTGNRGLND